MTVGLNFYGMANFDDIQHGFVFDIQTKPFFTEIV